MISDVETVKSKVKNFVDFLSSKGVVQETGQDYQRVTFSTLFNEDKQIFNQLLEDLKQISEK